MEPEHINAEDIKISYLDTALVNVGEVIAYYLGNADFQAIRTLKYYIDELFKEAQKAIDDSRFQAISSKN